jgi:hypothetical protein
VGGAFGGGSMIEFKGKVRTVYNVDDTVAYRFISVPKIARNHCNMQAFRVSRKFGSYANSDLFLGMMRGELESRGIRDRIKLDSLPDGVTVDESGFLAVVTIHVDMG